MSDKAAVVEEAKTATLDEENVAYDKAESEGKVTYRMIVREYFAARRNEKPRRSADQDSAEAIDPTGAKRGSR